MVKAIVIGLGSMGKRRVRCLRELGVQVLFGVDPRADRRAEADKLYGIATLAEATSWDLQRADVVVVSTPPDLHATCLTMALKAGRPCFVEASVVLAGLARLEREARRKRLLVFPSATMRYFKGPRMLRDLLRSGRVGKPLSFVYHSGQYLPDWHPWEKVSDYYVSRPATGACREIVPFELSWLTWLFGGVAGVKAQRAQKDRFGKGVEDLYQVLLGFDSGVHGVLQVDVLSRLPTRRFALETDRGQVVWDQYGGLTPTVTVALRGRKPAVASLVEASRSRRGINSDRPYIEELRDFLKAVRTKRRVADYSLAADITVLKTLERIREQSDEKAL